MQLKFQTSLLLLLTTSGPLALGHPVEGRDADSITIHHEPDGTAVFPNSTVSAASAADNKAAPSKKCISFTYDNPQWHYANVGVWGTASGTFASTGGKICVPHNQVGGAMFIGTEANPNAGNTKLEMQFPTSGTLAYGDISLVDGYSLSVKCTAGSKTIGGSTNLWKTGKPCYDTSLKSRGICKNDRGYAPAQKDVTNFFQEGVKNGNHFCIWQNCAQQPGWPVGADVKCHVSGSKP
ncbi:MAG: hypothetical protein Q9191_002344 [Dirinaria sp. TL-2023a]